MSAKQMISNLKNLEEKIHLASYSGQRPSCEKAWANACMILDRLKEGRNVSHNTIKHAFEWLETENKLK